MICCFTSHPCTKYNSICMKLSLRSVQGEVWLEQNFRVCMAPSCGSTNASSVWCFNHSFAISIAVGTDFQRFCGTFLWVNQSFECTVFSIAACHQHCSWLLYVQYLVPGVLFRTAHSTTVCSTHDVLLVFPSVVCMLPHGQAVLCTCATAGLQRLTAG